MAALGRRTPKDFTHVDKYPLTAMTAPFRPVPVAIGIDWFVEFDKPERDSKGHWWVARDSKLTKVRGGHCVCLKPKGFIDNRAWWRYYDQGQEGACVGFGCSRMMTLLNRRRYDGRWLWNAAKKVDEWPDTNPGDNNGTSVRAACDVLRTQGPERLGQKGPTAADGISANRWATTAADVLTVLGMPDHDYVQLLNSWGAYYPHIVRMPAEVLQKLLDDDGEACVVTDR